MLVGSLFSLAAQMYLEALGLGSALPLKACGVFA